MSPSLWTEAKRGTPFHTVYYVYDTNTMALEDVQPNTTGNSSSARPYLWLRRLFFILCIVVFLLALLFLIYYNGKSIYDNGI